MSVKLTVTPSVLLATRWLKTKRSGYFLAGDVEEPSLEKVVFLNNKTGKTWDMAKLDPVIFSETMRALDLVASVAHVGGVDPAYEHTTIELRLRILEHNLKLLGIKNYQIEGVHVTIEDNLHEYSLHLGSGIIHVAGRGTLPVFPIFSQQRGCIFLPFVDSDPKTAETTTRALMKTPLSSPICVKRILSLRRQCTQYSKFYNHMLSVCPHPTACIQRSH